jgi:hypothetical protein
VTAPADGSIQEGSDCLGDTRDAVYMDGDEPLAITPAVCCVFGFLRKGPSFQLSDDPNDFLVVVGVTHSRTPKPLATYINLAGAHAC